MKKILSFFLLLALVVAVIPKFMNVNAVANAIVGEEIDRVLETEEFGTLEFISEQTLYDAYSE